MKTEEFTALWGIACRYILSGIMLVALLMSNLSVAQAQSAFTATFQQQGGALVNSSAVLDNVGWGDDHCRDDDREGVQNSHPESSECSPVRINSVWTADGDMQAKRNFRVGDPIQWVITLKNTTGHIVSVTLIFDVKDPSGRTIEHSEMTVSAGTGASEWVVEGDVSEPAGEYSFTGRARYRDDITHKTAQYEVKSGDNGGSCYSLNINSNPVAAGTVDASPAPNCNQGAQYSRGTIVNLKAIPNQEYVFLSWSGAVRGTTNPITVTMNRNRSVTANFGQADGLTKGIYDDTHPGWTYMGDWSAITDAQAYQGTLHTSPTMGNLATVTTNGSQFILYFTGNVDHGSLDVYVDEIKIDTISQYSNTKVTQSTWTSPMLVPGVHTLKFVQVGEGWVDIDAIEVIGTHVVLPNWYISTVGDFLFGQQDDIPVPADYNGDGSADIAVYRPSNGTWYISALGNFAFGESGDIPLPGDYDGDGTADIAVYHPSNGTWYISTRGDVVFGEAGDIPVPADYNGDGIVDIAVFRPANGTWYISTRGNFVYGESGDQPLPSDYNGDGLADIAVYRPSNGTWYISTRGDFAFGEQDDIPVPADYNGDSTADIAVYRPSNGTWYISTRGNFVYGQSGDIPIPGDYDNDEWAEIAVFRP